MKINLKDIKVKEIAKDTTQKVMANPAVKWCTGVVMAFLKNNCSMHAAGLTYFSLLAVIPTLCILLFGAKQLGVDDYARTEINRQLDMMISNIENGQEDDMAMLASYLGTDEQREQRKMAALEFGKQARQISDILFEKIEQFNIKTLGWIGFGFLLWTVISSLSMVEVSFNEIWEVPKARPIWRRCALYLFISVVLPIIVALAMSVPTLTVIKDVIVATMGASWLTKWVSDGLIAMLESKLFAFAVMLTFTSLNFAFLFKVIPHKPVDSKRAFIGGLVTAVLFGGWIKVCAVAQVGIAKSSALYGSFAFLPIILAWIYMSWQIVLLGACMVRAMEVEIAQ